MNGERSTISVGASKDAADAYAAALRPTIERLLVSGHTSLHALARALNLEGVSARRGGEWHATSVRNLLERLQIKRHARRANIVEQECGATGDVR
jgi:hypothetical protein